ncbi:MAG: hypothetical protein QG589_235 [Patescibacteria group bacterium]|nr:hypothetical protein [Patescibacteria group bacterium]
MDLATIFTFSEKDIHLLQKVKERIVRIRAITLDRNGYKDDPGVTAYIVCEVLPRILTELEYAEGYYCNIPHCWVKTATGNIIDPLPVCSYEPVLLSSRCEATRTMYKPHKLYMRGVHNAGLIDELERALLVF